MNGEHGSSPTYAELMELYKIAVEEYRFQVTLNAARSRDYLVLNSAVIAAGVTLLGQKANLLAGAVFLAGACVATLAGLVTHTQHNYYREARDTKKSLEVRLGISDAVVKTTPATGSRRWRFASVTRFNYTVLTMLFVVNLLGALFSFSVLPVPAKSSPALRQRQHRPSKPTTPLPSKPQALHPYRP